MVPILGQSHERRVAVVLFGGCRRKESGQALQIHEPAKTTSGRASSQLLIPGFNPTSLSFSTYYVLGLLILSPI